MLFALLAATLAFAEDAVDDPYLWLEDVEGDKSLSWVEARNEESTTALQVGEYQALHDRIKSILDSNDRIPYVSKMGDHYYNFWQDAEHERGIWRRTTLEEYRKPKPVWETVIDIDALSKQDGVKWVWHGADCLDPEYVHCMIGLSPGGKDADILREFDLQKLAFVEGGFSLPNEAKQSISWVDADHLWVMTDMGEGSLTASGYPRTIREWTRGTPLSESKLIFEGKTEDVSVGGWVDHAENYGRSFIYRNPTFFTTEMHERRADGTMVKYDVPPEHNVFVYRDWVFVQTRDEWKVDGATWKAGTLLVEPYEAFHKGERKFEALFEPTATTSLQGASVTPSAVIIDSLDNVKSRVTLARFADGKWTKEAMTGLPDFGTVSVSPIDPDYSDDVWLTITDFLTPSTLSLGSVAKGAPAPEKVKSLPAMFDATGLEISQHMATSLDGTKIPYFQVSKKGLPLNGKNPTLLNGYGGFEVSLTPYYNASTGAAWLERGGVYVLANIRGGGEFGPDWHMSAIKENRHRVYEDFSAVAKDLAARKVTSPSHLGAIGGSNGGLLVGNMLVQYPKLFGAIVCQVPLLDMKRYNHLLAGASWVDEYGNPDDPAQWKYIQTFSPYQIVNAKTKYPPTLFITSTRDDRVHPGHARKMAAKMLDHKKDVLYWENTEGGHGAAATSEQRATMWALSWSFLWQELK